MNFIRPLINFIGPRVNFIRQPINFIRSLINFIGAGVKYSCAGVKFIKNMAQNTLTFKKINRSACGFIDPAPFDTPGETGQN
jgi:hypothetical protein